MEKIDMKFKIDESIHQGLTEGKFIRKGTVIIDPESQDIVSFLSENGKGIAQMFKVFNVASAGILATTFVYFQNNFQKINNQLESLDQKIDEQNRAKITSGIDLAVKAEKAIDVNNRNNQLVEARSKLAEGKDIYIGLFEKARKNIRNYRETLEVYLELIVCSKLVIARTYLLQKDIELARQTIIELEDFYKGALFKLVEAELNPKNNVMKAFLRGANIPVAIVKNQFLNQKSPEVYVQEELIRLQKGDYSVQEKFDYIFKRAKIVDYQFDSVIKDFIDFRENIEGFRLECTYHLTHPNEVRF